MMAHLSQECQLQVIEPSAIMELITDSRVNSNADLEM
jgi:hypothetical protein